MKKIVIACQKGGVAKTTLALNLLIEAIRRGHHCAVMDTDPQGSIHFIARERERIYFNKLPLVAENEKVEADLLIVDTPPLADPLLAKQLSDADLLIIPIKPSALDFSSAMKTIAIGKRMGVPTATVLMMPIPRTHEIEDTYKWATLNHVPCIGMVHNRIDVSRATQQGMGIYEMSPNHSCALEFSMIADEAFRMMQ